MLLFASSLSNLGQTFMIASLAVVGIAFWTAAVGLRRNDQRFIKVSYRASLGFSLTTLAAYSTLITAFFTHDFSIKYVANYSERAMPNFYLFCAGWGGQDGSLLFWTLLMGILSAVALVSVRKHQPKLFPAFLLVISAVQLFFAITTFFAADPFGTLPHTPADGKGLNPLLQTPVMAIHPPNLYMGLLSFYIPYALGMAAMISNQMDNQWIRATRPWTITAWCFLTLGNALGGYWAYQELGWGGFWAWDPVENASFLPWLTATAFLHSSIVQERHKMLKVWNMSLLIVTFFLTIFGTFLTRSGLISSIHAFARSDIGTYFVVFLVIIVVTSFGLMYLRRNELRSDHQLASPLSREVSFLFNNALFSIGTFIVLLGTTYPLWREWLTGTKATVGPPFFNRAMSPVALILLVLMGIIPLIKWRKTNPKKFFRLLVMPLIIGALGGVGFYLLYSQIGPGNPDVFTRIVTGLIVGLGVFSVATIFADLKNEASKRQDKRELSFFEAAIKHIKVQRRQYGGYLVHIGVVLAFIGIAGYGFRLEKKLSIIEGEIADIGDYIVKFDKLSIKSDKQKRMEEGTISLYKSRLQKRFAIKEETPIRLGGGKWTVTLGQLLDAGPSAKGKGKNTTSVMKQRELNRLLPAEQVAAIALYKGNKKVETYAPHQSISLGNQLIRFRELKWVGHGNKKHLEAKVEMLTPGQKITSLVPGKYKYNKSKQPTTEVALRTGLFDDFYVILVDWEAQPGQSRLGHFKFYLNPLVVWIWFGVLLMLLGGIIAGLPQGKKKEA